MKQEHIDTIVHNMRVTTHMELTVRNDDGVVITVFAGYVPIILENVEAWLEHTQCLASVYDLDNVVGEYQIVVQDNGSRTLKVTYNGDYVAEDMCMTFQLKLVRSDWLGLDSDGLDQWLNKE